MCYTKQVNLFDTLVHARLNFYLYVNYINTINNTI